MSAPQPDLRVVPPAPARCRALLKWCGSKRWFVREFGDSMFSRVIERGGRYIEPFLGGGAMALHLGLDNMVLGDIEEELMITYAMVRDEPEQLATLLGLVGEIGTDKVAYYRMRGTEPGSAVEIAARLIYLNKLCFNGLHRKNKKGEFNVPYCGDERALPDAERIKEVSRALAGAELHVGEFETLIERAGDGDVIYADPPYHETFSDYTAHGFGDDDHERLAEALYHARKRGAEFYAHNADTDKVRYWYGEWTEIIPMDERRAVNSDGNKRGEVPCVLIVGANE